MQTKILGNTGIGISAIGLGAMPMSVSNRPPEIQSIQVIHRALDLGITLIDTADSYCKIESDKHHNERLIYQALKQYGSRDTHVLVATKGGLMRPTPDAWICNGNPEHLRRAIQASFEALGGEQPIDIWQYHKPDPNYTIEASLLAAREAIADGFIRWVGVSNFSVEQIQRAREVVEIVSIQNQYSPWHRQPEFDGVLEYCQQEKLTFFPWRPLGGKQRQQLEQIPAIAELARAKGVSVYCLILAWLQAKSSCIVPIPGASQISSIEDSIKSLEVKLSAAEVAQIDRGTATLVS